MLKKTITYTDFNGDQQTEDLYFHLSKTELPDLLDLQPRLEAWAKKTNDGERELTFAETRELLDIIKTLVQKSYGVRSEDGKRFSKAPAMVADFQETAAYDAFVMSLFGDGGQAVNEFMTGIIPSDLMAQVNAEMETVNLPGEKATDDRPAWLRENREPNRKELAEMNDAELRLAYQMKSERERQGWVVPPLEK